ncbi:MAG: PAS domain-containing sensor histidine kinase [Desulfobulbaceae bacterium DB1]|nr:MAG: PAS domain-containing sensor histidine kinase [Desulfobulbaceae bacterium DB1]
MAIPHQQPRDDKKRKRVWTVIICCLILIPLLTLAETKVFQLGTVPFPVSGNVLVFVLINFNVLLLLLMVFLVLRNLAQLVFERKKKILGTKLRAKLVVAFVSLSLIPTALLFFISLQFVSTSMDYWFNIKVEQSLLESLHVAQDVYQEKKNELRRIGRNIAARIERQGYGNDQHLADFLDEIVVSHGLAALEVVSPQRSVVARAYGRQIEDGAVVPDVVPDLLRKALSGDETRIAIQKIGGNEMVRSLVPFTLRSEEENPHVLVCSLLIPQSRLEQMEVISLGLEGYRQLMLLKKPIKTSLLVMLLIVTLLIVFSAIWFGFYVARSLTDPIDRLAQATRRVADGELDFVVESDSGDEMGTLVDSFNQMTREVLASQKKFASSNQELENRRRYTEIILQNVAAGVISLDASGCITTLNRFAEELLKIDKRALVGHDFRKVLNPSHREILENFYKELGRSGKNTIEMPLRLSVREESFSLRVSMSRLVDENNRELGVVLVFDNLTELEKAQRMAAWREVARRIAHEVKNPLTPIQLSAQRLRKRYLEKLETDGEIFDVCTMTIINQVDELKRLVSEFSNFARMPAVQKSINSLQDMAREAMVLFREGHKEIDFSLTCSENVPAFSFDRKQMKRVLINLLDNAVSSVGGKGIVEVLINHDEDQKLVFLEVRDNGSGVKEGDRLHLFEPYFSTKKTGTGLGLAIASTVVADHGGYIRFKDNVPKGARFIIELPMG